VSLHALAARHGVARWYRGVNGARVDASPDTVMAVLAALGVDTTGGDWIAREARRLDEEAAARLVEPVVIAWDGRLGAGGRPTNAAATIVGEDGQVLSPDAPLPIGYHTLHVVARGRTDQALVISAPTRAWTDGGPRHRGVYAPLYALHPHGAAGPGDLHDLATLLDWVGAHGGDTVLTLPLLASFLDPPVEPSPYSPVSRLMWNELYAVTPHEPVPLAPDGLLDYAAAGAATRAALTAHAHAVDADPTARDALARHLRERPEVVDYARFRAAGERYGRNWRNWPARLRAGHIEPGDIDAQAARYHECAQWLTDTQLGELAADARARNRLLGLDLALGAHPDGYDVWREQAVFAHGASVGAPPDAFFVGGQGWGFPPLLPAAARATGHAYFRAALRHHVRHAGLLRIDHVMALHRLYWIPHGATPDTGAYVHYPADELFAIVCLESHRARALIVAEDLGVVPSAIERALARHGLFGAWVGQWELEALARDQPLQLPPRRALASLNTHDMPTFKGFLDGADIDDRLALHQIDSAAAGAQHEARADLVARARRALHAGTDQLLLRELLARIGSSRAAVALTNLEDLWLEPRPHNVPGTSAARPNWRRPAAHAVDRLDAVPGAADLARRLFRPSW
jgi:4-alpha-glucanotransferase